MGRRRAPLPSGWASSMAIRGCSFLGFHHEVQSLRECVRLLSSSFNGSKCFYLSPISEFYIRSFLSLVSPDANVIGSAALRRIHNRGFCSFLSGAQSRFQRMISRTSGIHNFQSTCYPAEFVRGLTPLLYVQNNMHSKVQRPNESWRPSSLGGQVDLWSLQNTHTISIAAD